MRRTTSWSSNLFRQAYKSKDPDIITIMMDFESNQSQSPITSSNNSKNTGRKGSITNSPSTPVINHLPNDNSPAGDQWKSMIPRSSLPEVKTRHGKVLDPSADDFLMKVVRESDRSLLRLITDHYPHLPLHVINYQDANGVTPLLYLCLRGDFILVKMLSDIRGIDVNLPDREGNTPLIVASQGGYSPVVSFLLDRFKGEIDVNWRNIFGFTAVMKAALQGRTKCLRSLLAAGANLNLRDPTRGYTALEWAELCGMKSCADVIRSYHKPSSSSKGAKRLSQAWSDTESWLKSLRIGGPSSPKDGNISPTGKAAAASAMIPLALGQMGQTDPDNLQEESRRKRSLVIPSISVTQANGQSDNVQQYRQNYQNYNNQQVVTYAV